MSTANDLPGFEVPLHRSLTEPILMGGAPRTVAIANGTLAAAVGLGLQLWIPGLVLWIVGHSLAVGRARRSAVHAGLRPAHQAQTAARRGDAAMLNLPNTASARPCSLTGCRGPGWSRPVSS